jgi:ankyrin repeat protein
MEAYDKIFEFASGGSYDQFIEFFESIDKKERNSLITDDYHGLNLLIASSIGGSLEIFQYLVENFNIDINKKHDLSIDGNLIEDVTALWCASYYCHVDIVKYLVSKGANVNATTSTQNTPLRYARQSTLKKIAFFKVLI